MNIKLKKMKEEKCCRQAKMSKITKYLYKTQKMKEEKTVKKIGKAKKK